MSDEWANRQQTQQILGISNAALILLQRDKVLKPDCITCGRIRWKRADLHRRRDEIRQYLIEHYGTVDSDLVMS